MDRSKIVGWAVIFASLVIFFLLYLQGRKINTKNNQNIVRDAENYQYRTIRIGGQVWMKENMRTSKNMNGNNLKNYLPNNDRKNLDRYGRLYDWKIAKTLCPKGWRLPSDNDWKILNNYLGSHAGAKMKDTLHWMGNTANTNNESGFSALPAGRGNHEGDENFFGTRAIFWTTTKADSNHVVCIMLVNNSDSLMRSNQKPSLAFSVRCLKE